MVEALSDHFGNCVTWELLYADDLVVIEDTQQKWISSLKAWKAVMESKGLNVNMKRSFLCLVLGMMSSRNLANGLVLSALLVSQITPSTPLPSPTPTPLPVPHPLPSPPPLPNPSPPPPPHPLPPTPSPPPPPHPLPPTPSPPPPPHPLPTPSPPPPHTHTEKILAAQTMFDSGVMARLLAHWCENCHWNRC